jgi:nucleolar protein 58
VSIETEGKKSEKMLVLFETPAGYAVFKLLDEKRIQQSDNLYEDFETVESAKNVVKLKCFQKFEDTTEALAAATAAVEGKMSKSLKKMLKKIGKWTLILMLFCF